MAEQEAKPLQEGDQGRLTRDTKALHNSRIYRKGALFTVEEFVTAASNPDPQPDDIDVDFYEGTDRLGSSVTFPADAVELVLTAAQMRARQLPSATEIRNAIAGELMGDFSTFETRETDHDGERSVEVYGETLEGLAFGFRVTVGEVWKTDL